MSLYWGKQEKFSHEKGRYKMKLKTRLVVAFVTITLMPIFLMYMVAVGLSSYQTKAFSEQYGLTEQIDLFSGNSVQAFNRLTQSFEEKIKKVAKATPEKFENQEYLTVLNNELKNYYAYLIVRKENQILFAGDEDLSIDEEILEQLPDYGNGQDSKEGGLYLDGESQHLVKQMDFTFADGENGSIFIISQVDELLPEVKAMLQEMLAAGIMILVIFRRVLQTLFQLVGFGISLEVDRTARIFRAFQNPRYGFVIPPIQVVRHSLSVTLCVVGFDRQNLVCCQHLCNLHRSFSCYAQCKDTLHDLSGFLVHNPFPLVVRVFPVPIGRICAKMFARIALCTHDSADFFACIPCVKIIEQIAERGKLVVAFVAVHTVIDCDIANITLGKKALGIIADFQIIAPHTGHIFDDNCLDLSGFCKAYHLIPAGSVKRNARNAVVNEKCEIWKSVVCCVLEQNLFLRRDLSRVFFPYCKDK